MGLGSVVRVGSIEVVLPTYNGVLYLETQIASIYNQTLRPERVLLRDDGSSDGTQSLICQLQQRYGAWLQVLPVDGNLGCVANVNRLLQATKAPYVALADQDDFWFPQKLEQSFKRLQQMEEQYGSETPLLVHSDLELVDKDGTPLGYSYIERQHLDPLRTASIDLALTNVVTGCTVLLNRALLEKALPIPFQAVMHDWWLALVASAFGRIELLAHATVQYRQHGVNLIGAHGLGIDYWAKRILFATSNSMTKWRINGCALQAEHFNLRYGKSISILPYLLRLSRARRILCLFKLRKTRSLVKHGPLRSLALYVMLILVPSDLRIGRSRVP
jgi:glycosyltransferase involved in cell wall biosynthesis